VKRISVPTRIGAAFFLAPAVMVLASGPALAADSILISNTETVQAHLNADGSVQDARVYEQVALQGNGTVTIKNPVSTANLRNLDGFGAFEVKDGNIVSTQTVNGEKRLRAVSDFGKVLPLKVAVTYKLDGKTVQAGDVVGKAGRLEVHYKVDNVTGKDQEVTYNDGTGKMVTETQKVVIPMVGSLSTVLPSTFTDVQSGEASMAGDGNGGTSMTFTMTLFGPIGSATSEFGYSAAIQDGLIPDASISALPVSPLDNPSFKGGAASYKAGADTGVTLTAGATEIDANVLKLRDGAQTLLAGLIQLSDGAKTLNTGLAVDAAPGANKLADGASQLKAGAGQLAAGLDTASAGAPSLLDGLAQVYGGLELVDGGLVKLYGGIGQLPAKAKPIHDGITQLLAGLGDKTTAGTLIYGVNAVRSGLETQAVPGLQQAIDGLYKVSPTAPGAYQKLDCAQKILNDVVNGTLTNATAGTPNFCYYDALTNPTYLTPVLKGLTDTANYGGGPNPELSKTVTAGVQAKIEASLATLANPASVETPTESNLVGGLYMIKAGLDTHLPEKYGADDPGGAGYGLGLVECGMDNTTLPDCDKAVPGLLQGLDLVDGGVSLLVNGVVTQVQGAVGHASDVAPAQNTLRGGVHAVMGGIDLLGEGGMTLLDGLDQLSAGASQLNDGTVELSAGANKLAAGLGTAATGSGQLSDGLAKAVDGGKALPAGASKLSAEGTSKLVEAGKATASDYGLKYALIVAGAERAKAEGMAYGAPAGATGATAYSLEISGANGNGGTDIGRGVGALALFGAGGGLALYRRFV